MNMLSKAIAIAATTIALVLLVTKHSEVSELSLVDRPTTLRMGLSATLPLPFTPRAQLERHPHTVALPDPVQENAERLQFTGFPTFAVTLSVAVAALVATVAAAHRRLVHQYQALSDDPEILVHGAASILAATVLSAAVASSSAAASLTYDEIQSLSYMELKGSGLASACPIVDGTGDQLKLQAGQYNMSNMCFEPTTFQVKLKETEEQPASKDWENTKLLTRLTYTLSGIDADLKVDNAGTWNFKERDGLDFEAVTLKMAKNPTHTVQGDRVTLLFTVKELEAKGQDGLFIGQFKVPSYRGATFMDPKGRGASTGYESQPGISANTDQDVFGRENAKRTDPGQGTIAMKVARVNASSGEVAGVFESIQTSDTDMGAHDANDVKVTGVWYARVAPA